MRAPRSGCLLLLLVAGTARAADVTYELDVPRSEFEGAVSVTSSMETFGDSNTTGSGGGGGTFDSPVQECLSGYAPNVGDPWFCLDNRAQVDWGSPAWSSLGVALNRLEGYLEVDESIPAFPVSVVVPTGLPLPPTVTINGTVDVAVDAIRIIDVSTPAAIFDLLAEDAPDPSATDPGPGPWSVLEPTLIEFAVDWCATFNVEGTPVGAVCATTEMQQNVPVRYRLERGPHPGVMSVFSADFGPVDFELPATQRFNRSLPGCEGPVVTVCTFDLTSVDIWISEFRINDLLGHFEYEVRVDPIPNQPQCNDVTDNEADSAVNYPFDASCARFDTASEISQCGDSQDNDLDLATDHPEDLSCRVPWQNDESLAPPPLARDVRARHFGAADPSAEGWSATTSGGCSTTTCPRAPVHYEDHGREQAWRIADGSTSGLLRYNADVAPPLDARAALDGWTLRARLQVEQTPDALDPAVNVMYGNGALRFRMDFGATAAGDPIVALGGGPPVPALTGLGDGYHDYELRFDPVASAARLLVDGVDRGVSYSGEPGPTNGVQFGSGSTADVGSARYALVEWQIDATECGDGVDNDGDGSTDLADAACIDAFGLSESPCDNGLGNNGLDDDGDGSADWGGPFFDFGCTSAADPSEREPTIACDDGVDNDSDGRTDYPADPGCPWPWDLDETNPTLVVAEHIGPIDPVLEGFEPDFDAGEFGVDALVAPGGDAVRPGWTIEDSTSSGWCDVDQSANPFAPCTSNAQCPGRLVQGDCLWGSCEYGSASWGDLCVNDVGCLDGAYDSGWCVQAAEDLQRAYYRKPVGPLPPEAQGRGWIARTVIDVESFVPPDGSISVIARSGFGVGQTSSGPQIRRLPDGPIGTLPFGSGRLHLFQMKYDPALAQVRLSIDAFTLLTEPANLTPPVDLAFGSSGVGLGRGDYKLVQLVVGVAPECPGLPTPPPGADTDGDGLADSTEQIFHQTNPCLVDTDGDGLTDSVEVALTQTDPTDPDTDWDGVGDALDDGDLDGLTNGAEVDVYGTNPLDADSDNDALTDGFEVVTSATNPLDSDSDDDGLADGAEVQTTATNPLDADSDDDGLQDGPEVNTHGTNPNDSDTDNDYLSDGAEVNVYGTDPLVPEPNADADTFPDLVDNCDYVANDQSDQSGDGVGDACTCGELDGDGIGAQAGDVAALRGHLANPTGSPLPPGAPGRCAVAIGSSGCNLLQSVVMRRSLAALAPAAGHACAAANPAESLPSDFADLVLWLDANDAQTLSTDGQGRLVWADKSPSGLAVTAPSASSGPAVAEGVVGGLRALRFDGQNDVMCAQGTLDLSGGATIFVVGRNRGRKNYNGVFSLRAAVAGQPSAGPSELEVYWQAGTTDAGSGNLVYVANRSTAPDFFQRNDLRPAVGAAYLATIEVPSTSVPGTIATQGASGPNTQVETNDAALLPDAPAQPCVGYGFGDSPTAARLLDGDLAEIVVYARALPDDQRRWIEHALQVKWSTRFDPASLGSVALWLDADDHSSVTLASDRSVMSWRDRRYGRDTLVPPGVAERPVWGPIGYTAPTVTFDGANDYLCGATPIDLSNAGNPGGVTYYFVARNHVRKSYNGILSLRTGSSINAAQEIYWQSGTTNAGSGNLVILDDRGVAGTASVSFNDAPPPVGSLGVFLMQIASPTTLGLTHIDGVARAPTSATASNLLPNSAAPPCVGYGFGATPAGNTLDGEIAEILVFDETLGASDAALVESYLLRKWNRP